jgi:hypothetical protein
VTAPHRPTWQASENVPGGWQTCPICQKIPEQAAALWIGGEVRTGGLPETARRLEVVGAPYHDDCTGYSHDCLKRCPVCETCYAWAYTHEYLAGATEETFTLTRLNTFEGRERVRALLEELRVLETEFRAAAAPHLEALRQHRDAVRLTAAAGFLHQGGVKGFDLGFAVDALVAALARHAHAAAGPCAGGDALMLALGAYAVRGMAQRRDLCARLRAVAGPSAAPEVDALTALCVR